MSLRGLPLLLALGASSALGDDRGLVDPSRAAGEYFVQRAGATWVYQLPKGGKARWTITSFVEWKASYAFTFGKRSGSGTWRVKESAWLEHSALRGPGEVVLLPAVLKEGTQWEAPASVERGTSATSRYEVMTLNATVALPNGVSVDHCLAVLETEKDGSRPWTHYWAPNLGKVAVRGPDDWVLRLLEFTGGGNAGHAN